MPSPLSEAHIEAERRLRALVVRAVEGIWKALPGYDREHVDQWLSAVLPVVLAGQRQSVALTDAFLAHALARGPVGVDPEALIGAAVRNGTPPEEVYQRPFVTIWTKLSRGLPYEDAVSAGLARALDTAATDVQLSMRATLRAVAE